MRPERQFQRVPRLMQREAAEQYLFVTLLSFAASVSLTRLFLALTGYPQIGGGELHIAHVLWGGLLLFAAALLPLILANRGVYTASALLAGAGVGLFIDEVGKFITQRNDYFFPAAAPIIYTFFLLVVLLLLHLVRLSDASARPELLRALEEIGESFHHALPSKARDQLKARLESVASSPASQRHVDLAQALLQFMEGDDRPVAPVRDRSWRWPDWSGRRAIARLASDSSLRIALIVGLLAIGLLTLKNPLHLLLGQRLPPGVNIFLDSLYAGRRIEATTAPIWFEVRLSLELIVGILLIASAGLLAVGRTRHGAALGYVAVLLSLTTVNLLLFYFEQFSRSITTAIQFLLLLGLLDYRRRLRPA